MSHFYSNTFSATLLSKIPDRDAGLNIVSGYVSSSAIYWALSRGDASAIGLNYPSNTPLIRIVIGMAASGSITASEHTNFADLSQRFRQFVDVRYAHPTQMPLIHSKLYSITMNEDPIHGFIGSANFTNSGLGLNGNFQENLMIDADPKFSFDYFERLFSRSISCSDSSVLDLFSFPKYRQNIFAGHHATTAIEGKGLESHYFYLFSKRNNAAYAPGAGINWGISTNSRSRRSPDEAYLSIPASVSRSGFFPKKNIPFSITCDDGVELLLRGASGNSDTHPSGKDLSSLPSNSTLGSYLRKRLGVASGTYVDMDVLRRSRKSYVKISKLSDGTYYLEI